MQKVYAVYNDDIKPAYDANGFYKEELLAGTYDGGIRNYKCFLKAGCSVQPELHAKETVLLMFGKGKGYISSEKHLFNITEVAVYAANFDKEPYTITAIDDMEFIISVVEMNQWDWKVFNASHVRLPFFVLMSDCVIYDQDCKGPHTDSWWILSPQQLGRIMLGIVRANGEGTVEKGHPKVEQWNYCLGNADFNLHQSIGGFFDSGCDVCGICPDLSVRTEIPYSDYQIHCFGAVSCPSDDDARDGLRNHHLCFDNKISGSADAD